ncbi:MAG: hypothetical protein IKO42_00045 [Opitutales bacterium]|nr:hypothetical protein [Opitutales bacterium]
MFAFSTFKMPEELLPIIAAAMYCISVMLVKSSAKRRALSGASILVMNNLLAGLVFVPQIFLAGDMPGLGAAWQPMLAGAFCAAGNIATFICAERGEVSLMTPIMGVKILIVILLARILLNESLPSSTTLAGAVCCAAVLLMGWRKNSLKSGSAKATIALALAACSFYAACDVLLQKFSPNFEKGQLLGLMCAALPLSIIPLMPRFFREIARARRSELAFGFLSAALMTGEMFLMVLAITGSVGASLCNILYNTRGVMAVALVYIGGAKFESVHELDRSAAARRLAGSLMILAAVSAVLI